MSNNQILWLKEAIKIYHKPNISDKICITFSHFIWTYMN